MSYDFNHGGSWFAGNYMNWRDQLSFEVYNYIEYDGGVHYVIKEKAEEFLERLKTELTQRFPDFDEFMRDRTEMFIRWLREAIESGGRLEWS